MVGMLESDRTMLAASVLSIDGVPTDEVITSVKLPYVTTKCSYGNLHYQYIGGVLYLMSAMDWPNRRIRVGGSKKPITIIGYPYHRRMKYA